MNKEKELRSLTWKYFWKRKRAEIWGASWVLLFWQMMILFIVMLCFVGWEETNSQEAVIGLLLFIILLAEVAILGIGVLVFILVGWLRANWKLATKDAKKEAAGASHDTSERGKN